MANLCIDIGNTFMKCAVVRGNNVLERRVSKRLLVQDIKQLKKSHGFSSVIIGASGKIPPSLRNHLDRNYPLTILDQNTPLPISIKYKTPETLGRDRVAAVVGANALYPSSNNCVISIGTCITYDVILESKEYLGGNIAPGVYLRLKSMHDYTARLPLVEKGSFRSFLGRTTEEALQNGATLGTLLEIESFIMRIKREIGDINVILTGGDADFFGKKINSKIFVHSNLVLIGLNQILDFNA